MARPQVLLAMAQSLLVCAVTFSVFTYISPMLTEVTGISAAGIPLMLFLFGIGGTFGLIYAGRRIRLGQLQMVLCLLLAQFATFAALLVLMDRPLAVGALLLVWGFLFMAPCVPLQTRVVEKAIDAPNLASALNQAAFNVGNAIGPILGAAALSAGIGYSLLPLVGLALTILAVAVSLAALWDTRREIASPVSG